MRGSRRIEGGVWERHYR